MERLTLDEEGARQGRVFEHSIQLGDDTVTFQGIATMGVETHSFKPYDTPRNRRSMGGYVVFGALFLLVAMFALAWWGMTGGAITQPSAIVGLLCGAVFLALALIAANMWRKIQTVKKYFRLRIGTSDGQQIYLVDDHKRTLEQLRDAIRMKIDENDTNIVGTFDLNTDTISLSRREPGGAVS